MYDHIRADHHASLMLLLQQKVTEAKQLYMMNGERLYAPDSSMTKPIRVSVIKQMPKNILTS